MRAADPDNNTRSGASSSSTPPLHAEVRAADCVFCNKLKNETFDPAYQFSNCVAFEPLNPVTPGHLLVIPRQHAANINELSGKAIEDVGYALRYFTNDIESYNIITSKGSDATQTVFHLHWHIIPRRKGDGLMLPWDAVTRVIGELGTGS